MLDDPSWRSAINLDEIEQKDSIAGMIVSGMLMHNDLRRIKAIQEVAKLVIGIFKCLSTQEFPGRDEVKDSKMMKIKQAIAEYAESIRQDRDAAAGEDDQAGSSIFDRYRQYRPSGAIQRVKHPVVAGTYPTFVTKILLNLSEKHVGATVILDVKRRSFEDTVLSEIIMDAEGDVRILGDRSLSNIFDTKSPGHDGAVIISLFMDNKSCAHIAATQCWLPIDGRRKDRKEGTRHGSAKTLSLLTNAPIFVISEERGTVSYAVDGLLERDVNTERLITIITASIARELLREDNPIMAQPLLDPPSTNLLVLNLRIVPYSFTRLSSEQLWYTCRYQETHMQLHQGFPRKLFLPNCDDDAPVSPVDTGMLDFIERSAMRDLQLLQANPSMRCWVVEYCGVRIGGYFVHFDSDRSTMVVHHPFLRHFRGFPVASLCCS